MSALDSRLQTYNRTLSFTESSYFSLNRGQTIWKFVEKCGRLQVLKTWVWNLQPICSFNFTLQQCGRIFKANLVSSFACVASFYFPLQADRGGISVSTLARKFCSRGGSRTKRRWPWMASMVPESKGPVNGTCHFHSALPVIRATRNDAQISG